MLASRVAVRSARAAAPRVSIAASRSFAEASKSSVDSKPPVQLFGVDGTYASALVGEHPRFATAENPSECLYSDISVYRGGEEPVPR